MAKLIHIHEWVLLAVFLCAPVIQAQETDQLPPRTIRVSNRSHLIQHPCRPGALAYLALNSPLGAATEQVQLAGERSATKWSAGTNPGSYSGRPQLPRAEL